MKPLNPQFANLTTTVQFFTVVIIWSFTPLAAVWTIREMHWAWGLFIRFSIALPVAWLLLRSFAIQLPLHAQALRSYCAGAVGLFGSMTLCYIGAQHVPSAVISMVFGLAPLVSGLVAVTVLRSERMSYLQAVALLLSLVGMALALGLNQGGLHFHAVGMAFVVAAMLLYVLSTVWVRQIAAQVHPLSQTLGATLFSWLGYLLLLPFFTQAVPTHWPSQQAIAALLYTAIASSVLAMLCYYALIQRVSATTAMLSTITTPVLAACWGTWLNHEFLGSHFWTGLLLLSFGLVIYAYAKPQR